jgi:hypothetical protein
VLMKIPDDIFPAPALVVDTGVHDQAYRPEKLVR